jgi:hypothetical protein
MTVPRIPFAYTLIDKRHKGFAEGKRDILLSFAHIIFSPTFIFALIFGGLGVYFFLCPGIRGLVRDFTVRNDWVLINATMTSVVPLQSGDHFNWHYLYTFHTEDGRQVSGKIVESSSGVFREGQSVPIRYLRTDPTENVYALDPMPKNILYWVFVGLGAFWVYIAAAPIYRHLKQYRIIRAISRQGQIVPGQITAVHRPPARSNSLDVKLEYVFTSPAGVRCQAREAISLMYLTDNPKPGTPVAVWWTQDRAMLL